jgi:hypothetical protein
LLDGHELTRAFEPELAIPEHVTRLNDFGGEHRNHDLIVVGSAAGGQTLFAVEGKADESFGSTVGSYLALCKRREEERPAKVKEAIARGRRPPGPSNVPCRCGLASARARGHLTDVRYYPGTRTPPRIVPRLGKSLLRAMAPGGVEPPHADSKSAALSAELRGPRKECSPGPR